MRKSYNLNGQLRAVITAIKSEISKLILSTGSTELLFTEPFHIAVKTDNEMWEEEVASISIKEDGEIYFLFSTADYEIEESTIIESEWLIVLEEVENTLNIQ